MLVKNREYLFVILLVDCEWSNWYVEQKCNKTCGGGSEVIARKKILTNSLRSQGYTSCRGMGRQEDIRKCNTQCCKGTSFTSLLTLLYS